MPRHNNFYLVPDEPPPDLPSREKAAFFRDILDRALSLRVRVTGYSMAPFLNGGEILTIRKVCTTSLRKGDLIFCVTRDSSMLLHRIVGKRVMDGALVFQTKGDALYCIDEPVHERDILGRVCRIESTLSDGRVSRIEMESGIWRVINYFQAIAGLGRSKITTLSRRGLPSHFGRIIRRFFPKSKVTTP